MMEFSVLARFTCAPSSLLVTLLTLRAVLVCPPPEFPFRSQPSVAPLPASFLWLGFTDRFCCLHVPALTSSISIGRPSLTR